MILRNVYDQVKLMVSDHLHYIILCTWFLIRPVNRSRVYSMSIQECSSSGSSINLISLSKQHTAGIQQTHFRLHSTGREHYCSFRNLESGSDHCIQQCFREIITDTSNFTCRRHIHTQYRVSLVQTRERELRCFYTNPVDIKCRFIRT